MAETRDAAAWFAVVRRGLMTQEERVALTAWRSEPHNARALESLQRLWDEMGAASSGKDGPSVREASLSRSARLVAVLTAASIMVTVIYRLDGPWWTTLDWWSR